MPYICDMSAAFYLVHRNTQTFITCPALGLRIDVYNLEKELFMPTAGRLDFYGVTPVACYAFETEIPKLPNLDSITAALQWYAAYVQYPDMEFSLLDPRKNLQLKV
jgi:hypothetical protein